MRFVAAVAAATTTATTIAMNNKKRSSLPAPSDSWVYDRTYKQ